MYIIVRTYDLQNLQIYLVDQKLTKLNENKIIKK